MQFKDKDLSTYNAILLQRGQKKKPKKVFYEYGNVLGSSEALYEDTGTYESYQREIHILSKAVEELPSLYAWLDGAGILEIESGGYYDARVLDVDPVTESLEMGWTRLIVTFEVQPFFHSFPQAVTVTSGQVITNPGLPVRPYLKITGSGNVTISVNGKAYRINSVNQYVELDYPFAYKGTLNQGRSLLDGFPLLETGNNTITWTGTVTKVEAKLTWHTL